MHRGFAKLYRKFLEWEWYDDIPCKVLYVHCLLKANYKDKKYHGVTVQRGTFLTSFEGLAAETGLTVRQVRTAQSKLEPEYLTSRRTNKGQAISVVDFDTYNSYDDESDTQKGKQGTSKGHASDMQEGTQGTSEGHAEDTQRATTKKEKKEKKEEKALGTDVGTPASGPADKAGGKSLADKVKPTEPPESFNRRQREFYIAFLETEFYVPGEGPVRAIEKIADPVRLAATLGDGKSYPLVDVGLISRLGAWTFENKRKAKRDIGKFILNRSRVTQDHGGPRTPGGGGGNSPNTQYRDLEQVMKDL